MSHETPRIPCVGGIVVDAGKLLLVQRGQQPSLGLWSIPGGRLEDGESPEEGCAREVLEETGVRVAVGRLVGTVERDAPSGGIYVIADYLCAPRHDDGAQPEAVAGDDAADARWFDVAEVVALDTDGLMAPGVLTALRTWGLVP
ncbi:NUDIX domain-containing protein [Longivirga aurantiaca]|uniref:NUDIX domain-containing protein n=1 Tax=Longivirga aurantiaca TaxID=1837743 RepID=A0ABW1SZN4_9ACTN